MPVTLLTPIQIIKGESIFNREDTSSYPFPKNQGTKLFETAISPKQIGIDKKQIYSFPVMTILICLYLLMHDNDRFCSSSLYSWSNNSKSCSSDFQCLFIISTLK